VANSTFVIGDAPQAKRGVARQFFWLRNSRNSRTEV